tara:strand:+ start:939 stop:2540 length:1602 start_codon:yes stop_codon:yes gene_type:complete
MSSLEETILGTVKITSTAKNETFQKQATGIIDKLGGLTEKINNQRANRETMLQSVYNSIADMKLKDNGKPVEPQSEAELVTAIEFLKTNDSIEKAELKNLYEEINKSELPEAGNVESLDTLSAFINSTKQTITESKEESATIYETIKQSTLPSAIDVDSKDTLTSFISATEGGIKMGEEALSNAKKDIADANETIAGCQKHFDDIETKLSELGDVVVPYDDYITAPTKKSSAERSAVSRVTDKETYKGTIDRLKEMVKGVVDVSNYGILVSGKLTTESKIDKTLKEAEYVKRASELIKFQIILKYVIMIMKDNPNAQRAIKDVLKPIETGLKVNIGMTKYEDVIKELLGITSDTVDSQPDKNGKISKLTVFKKPTTAPVLSFEQKCLAILLTKKNDRIAKSSLRYQEAEITVEPEKDEVPKYIQVTINQYEKDVENDLISFLTSGNVVDLLSASNVEIVSPRGGRDKNFVEDFIPDAKGANAFMSDIISSKKTGGKTMKKIRNLNKGGKTIRKMFKRTLKRGGNFIKKLTKRR